MSDTLSAEIAALKTNMANLHAGVSDIQTRLTTAIGNAANAGVDQSALAELHGINDDLASVTASLAPQAAQPAAAGPAA